MCSYCAEFFPSEVTAVHPSFQCLAAQVPAQNIGSIVNVLTALHKTDRPCSRNVVRNRRRTVKQLPNTMAAIVLHARPFFAFNGFILNELTYGSKPLPWTTRIDGFSIALSVALAIVCFLNFALSLVFAHPDDERLRGSP